MESRYIAAIEIGSSKIKGIVATVDATKAIAITAVEETDSGDSVRYGRVQNAREVSQRVNDIIRRLENNPRLNGGHITTVFVANGGRSVMSAYAEATVRLGGEAEITRQVVERLHKEARYALATDRDILAIDDRRYVVDNTEVKKIIGTFGNSVHGEFTFVTASPENLRNLDRVKIESHGKDIPRSYLPRIMALASLVLSDSERQLGSMLVDLGAETTTVAIYRNNALMMLATLPMGSANITRDLSTGLGITLQAAENLKLTKGRAAADRLKNPDPDADTTEINNYVSARAGEIIANILNIINADNSGFKPADLPGGIILCGGGSRLKGFDTMLETISKMKVRRAAVDGGITGGGMETASHIDAIALVKYAADTTDQNCVEFDAAPVAETAPAQQAATTATPAATAAPAAAVTPGRRAVPAEDDPSLLDDDIEDQPDNINNDELPEPGPDPETTRKNLIQRFMNWLSAPKEVGLDEDMSHTPEDPKS